MLDYKIANTDFSLYFLMVYIRPKIIVRFYNQRDVLLAILRGCLFPAFYLEFIVIHDLRSHFENDKLCVLTNRLKANEDKKKRF